MIRVICNLLSIVTLGMSTELTGAASDLGLISFLYIGYVIVEIEGKYAFGYIFFFFFFGWAENRRFQDKVSCISATRDV